ncbi:hypothetical protein BC830DRAFT_1153041 [Chytriomyces sp. MP71]|nr:hypothetical protein BC830DRAFT_1153041 [Chytriomyces sp. MP71]
MKRTGRKYLLAIAAVNFALLLWTQLTVSTLVSDRKLTHRFPFAHSERLTSNATIYKPIHESAGFSVPELLNLCNQGQAMTITRYWALEAPKFDDTARHFIIHNFMNECYPLEMTTSQGARSMGFCSDYIQYIYHANGRLVDEFDDSIFHAKRITCPNSTFLHGEYLTYALLHDIPIDKIDKKQVAILSNSTKSLLPSRLPRVRNVWLPNLEQVTHDQVSVIPLMHKILCKTKITCTVMQRFVTNNNVDQAPLFKFMSHSTPDVLEDAKKLFGEPRYTYLLNKTRNYNKYLHAFGRTYTKRTDEVITCWLRNPQWPTLTLVGDPAAYGRTPHPYQPWMDQHMRVRLAHNIRQTGFLNIPALRAIQLSHGVSVCSSAMEGYGHFINDARSAGSVVITTDHAPMNEFVRKNGVDGVLIGNGGLVALAENAFHKEWAGWAGVRPGDICKAVERVMNMSLSEREAMGWAGRKSYETDTAIMIENMKELSEEARLHLGLRTT